LMETFKFSSTTAVTQERVTHLAVSWPICKFLELLCLAVSSNGFQETRM